MSIATTTWHERLARECVPDALVRHHSFGKADTNPLDIVPHAARGRLDTNTSEALVPRGVAATS